MSQRPSKMAERQDAVSGDGLLKVGGMKIFQNREDRGREPSVGSGGNSSSEARAEKLLLDSKLNDAKLETEEI